MIKDLTEGKPSSVLWRFSIPMFVSVIFQQLYNIADSAIAGKFAGESALAAVGASYPITMIFMAVAVGSNIGCSVVISQLFGAKRYTEMKTAVSTTLFSSGVLAVALMVLGLLGTNGLLRLLNTPEDVFADGAVYLKIYIGGFLFLFLYNICTGVFTSLGDSRTPLYFLIGSSLSNIFLDYWFVTSFHMGVAGVAWATFLAQGAACILAFFTLLYRLRKIRTQERPPVFSLSMLKRVSRIAIPSILQQSFISVGNIFIQWRVNQFGSSVIAGYSAAIKLNTFTITSFTTLANGLSGFTAQNVGAGKTGRVREGLRSGILLAFLIAIPFAIAFFFFGTTMIRLFLPAGSDVGEALLTGRDFLKIVSPFYFVISVKLMADGVLRGAGAMKYFMTATFTDLVLRVILAFLFSMVPSLGATGIWLSWPVGWTTATIVSCVFYQTGKWRHGRI
ncbi:MAG: MATE family efflux transporter [Lachnospiraceae bacterium]|nr:MATE family efflux transporter [Lachnospiraceae bacterium]